MRVWTKRADFKTEAYFGQHVLYDLQLSGVSSKCRVMPMNTKKKKVLDRIKHLEDAIAKGHEYLRTGAHAEWSGFRPLFFD